MPQHAHAMEPEPAPAWTLTTDGAVFFGFNGQQREFTDFYTWESQNWFMVDAARPVGNGRLTLDGMISLKRNNRERALEMFRRCVALGPKSCLAKQCRIAD